MVQQRICVGEGGCCPTILDLTHCARSSAVQKIPQRVAFIMKTPPCHNVHFNHNSCIIGRPERVACSLCLYVVPP